jgi:hypothetical protein
MEGPRLRLLISSRSVDKHCRHRQFLFLIGRFSILYRGPSIDASYQDSDHLVNQFQWRRFLEIDQLETRIVCGNSCFRLFDF